MAALEETILGYILVNRFQPEQLGLDKDFFRNQRQRQVFNEIKKGNYQIDLIVENIGGDGAAQDVAAWMAGVPETKHEDVIKMISEIQTKRLNEEVRKLIHAGSQSGQYDDEKIGKIYKQIQDIECGGNKDEECETVEELALLEIPEIDWLIKPIVERFGFTLIGAQKGVGKSLVVTQLGLYAAAGISTFLSDEIKIREPLNVLLVQQEVSLPGMVDRLYKMRAEKVFELGGRFRQKTTTGNWWNLTKKEDLQKLRSLIEKYHPDVLILDPLYTFYPKELNTAGDISPMMEVLSDLKTNYNLGLVVVHHFSNKEDPDSQRTSVGRFMGHSMIANSADVTVGLDFLHPKYKQQSLPLPYQNYVMVEITTRHGEWPARFALERKLGGLLFGPSSIWQDLGRSIIPGQIEDLIDANDGEMMQKDVISALISEAKSTTIRRAIDEAIKRGSIFKDILPGKGNPVLLRLAK